MVNTRDEFFNSLCNYDSDFSEVKGQENIKRALEIAAAGGHNVILSKPKVYHAYNILGEKFNIIRYDELGNISEFKGFIVSSKIYSFTDYKDSLVILKDHGEYKNIKDLFLNVATPPNVHFSIAIDINNERQKDLVIKDNAVVISNALDKKGDYIIKIHEQIQDKKNKLLKDDSLKMTIKKT